MGENCFLCNESIALANGACRTCNRDKFAIVQLLTKPESVQKVKQDKLPSAPTQIPPGKKKIAVFQLRRSLGESLFHPEDYIPEKQEPKKKKVEPQVVRVRKYHGKSLDDQEDEN